MNDPSAPKRPQSAPQRSAPVATSRASQQPRTGTDLSGMTVSRAFISPAVPTAAVSHRGVASSRSRVTSSPPAPAGWSGAAMAVHSVRQIDRPVLVALRLPEHEPIWIDLRSNTYVWDSELGVLPLDPETVQLRTRAIESTDPEVEGEPQNLDPLLWIVGLNAFPGRATWLRAGDKYRLKVRPDFASLTISPDEMKLVKALARGLMTVEQLGERCGLPDSRAQRVVNALSLMDVLRRVEAPDAAPELPPMTLDS